MSGADTKERAGVAHLANKITRSEQSRALRADRSEKGLGKYAARGSVCAGPECEEWRRGVESDKLGADRFAGTLPSREPTRVHGQYSVILLIN